MKKVLLILVLLGCSSIFAQTNEKLLPKDKVIYCPTKITCENKTCTFDSEDTKYFGKLSIIKNDGSPLDASYPYKSTTANFHSRNTQANCNYVNLQLDIKTASNLEAYRIDGSSWSGKNPTETCSGNCPLHESMGFVIINDIHPGGAYVSIDQQDISKLITTNSRIIFDDILLQCGELKKCVIDIQSEQRDTYGYIVVDTDTMKILQVNSLDPSIKINKIDGLNAVEINKIDSEKEDEPIYCPPVLKCHKDNGLCTFTSIDGIYFGKIALRMSKKTNSDLSFKFNAASVDDYAPGESTCFYDSPEGVATLSTNYLLENYSSKSDSKWKLQGSHYTCVSTSAINCPFKNRFDIVIYNDNVGNGLYASIANTYISKLFVNNDYLSIAQHDAVPECGEKTECTINLLSSQQTQYGSVTIDMKTMKILRVDSLYPNYIKISKVSNALYDMVEVRYITNLKHLPSNLN